EAYVDDGKEPLMTVLRRLAISLGLAAAPGLLLTAAALGGSYQSSRIPHSRPGSNDYAHVIRPLVQKYCLGCHSTRVKKGSLDLERFAGPTDLRRDLKPWQGAIEHLEIGDMPPRGLPQPTDVEKRRFIVWVRDFLAVEAKAQAGDPGYVPLRRLSN